MENFENLSLRKENRQMETDRNLISLMARERIAPLLDLIFEADVNLEGIENFEKYLWELYEQEGYAMIMAIIKSLFIINGLDVPIILGTIIQSGRKQIDSCYTYEFLMDLNELIEDFKCEV